MPSPKKARHRNAHELTIIKLWKLLQCEYPGDNIWGNTKFKHEKRPVPETNVFPDVINFSKYVAYEVHWAGERKEDAFDRLPKPWRGVNVFIVDVWQTEDVYIFSLDDHYVHLTSEDWQVSP